MSKFQVYSTEDLIILESKKQTIAAIGFSLSRQENVPFVNLADSIENYLNAFGYSYVIKITKSYTRFFLLISAKNPGDAINEVSKILTKMERLKPTSQKLVISPLNHSVIMKNIQLKAHSKIRRTQNPRIMRIDDKFWLIYSLIIGHQERNYFTKFLKSLLSLKSSTLNLSIKNTKGRGRKRKNPQITNSILLTQSFESIEECENFLNRMKQISVQYQERFSCRLRFHTASEVKQNIFLYMLGLSPVNQPVRQWFDVLKLDRFIPVIANYTNEIINTSESEIHRKLISVESGSNESKQRESVTETKDEKEIQTEEDSIEKQESLIRYGRRVSKEEIDELVETIPAPPI